ncbi:hypothetical protein AN640_02855 [Candidatus Epulonipiscium fishelsonii]|uniref:Uncharacterized protein n=1 Tax=Candidatus Epulonipiscium fishelsonii TaxID=77094 RepID=A0ACC8X8J0_9FIRM|nr:hypothetical protein AN640_02855 [Epulopiscium sp. SCG-D08WGA-EpuloA1]OON94654.1 MAG: hypothetical protein ATN32_08035 [Epulopiscium sp. AS2M-Bin002]
MFGLFGNNDGVFLSRGDFKNAEVDNYISYEDGEFVCFLIKSPDEEHCFTNKGYYRLKGTDLDRYEFNRHKLEDVEFELAGRFDGDVEVKFIIGGDKINVDINKAQSEQAKDLYKILYKLSSVQNFEEDDYSDVFEQFLDN